MTTSAPPAATDFKVADLALADFGRKEIRLAEHEMPGLMSIRAEFADAACDKLGVLRAKIKNKDKFMLHKK